MYWCVKLTLFLPCLELVAYWADLWPLPLHRPLKYDLSEVQATLSSLDIQEERKHVNTSRRGFTSRLQINYFYKWWMSDTFHSAKFAQNFISSNAWLELELKSGFKLDLGLGLRLLLGPRLISGQGTWIHTYCTSFTTSHFPSLSQVTHGRNIQ